MVKEHVKRARWLVWLLAFLVARTALSRVSVDVAREHYRKGAAALGDAQDLVCFPKKLHPVSQGLGRG